MQSAGRSAQPSHTYLVWTLFLDSPVFHLFPVFPALCSLHTTHSRLGVSCLRVAGMVTGQCEEDLNSSRCRDSEVMRPARPGLMTAGSDVTDDTNSLHSCLANQKCLICFVFFAYSTYALVAARSKRWKNKFFVHFKVLRTLEFNRTIWSDVSTAPMYLLYSMTAAGFSTGRPVSHVHFSWHSSHGGIMQCCYEVHITFVVPDKHCDRRTRTEDKIATFQFLFSQIFR